MTMFKMFHQTFWKNPISWWGFALFLWFTGIGGRDLYALPALVGLVCFLIQSFCIDDLLKKSDLLLKHRKVIFCLFGGFSLLLFFTVIAKTYAFAWNIYDVGVNSNVAYNLSQGIAYNSFLQMKSWADHFVPSLFVFAPFYWLNPNPLWLLVSKLLSYLAVPFALNYWLSFQKITSEKRWGLVVLLSVWWLILYKPAVSGRIFEFSTSALAPALLVLSYSFLERRKWLLFLPIILFLLGLKEHMGVVLLSFGLHSFFARDCKKSGILLSSLGFMIALGSILVLMPYFRDYQEFGTKLAPFNDLPQKSFYLVKLLAPLAFLPLIFWRHGVLALPAVGVNLVADRPNMYSTWYHYNDLVSTFLLMAVALILIEHHTVLARWFRGKWGKASFAGFVASVFVTLPPYSPVLDFLNHLPTETHWQVRKELKKLENEFATESLALQAALGPQVYRLLVSRILQNQQTQACQAIPIEGQPPQIWVLSRHVGHHEIDDLEQCIQSLESSNQFTKKLGYQTLLVFERKAS